MLIKDNFDISNYRYSNFYKVIRIRLTFPQQSLIAVVSGSGDASDGNLRGISNPNVSL